MPEQMPRIVAILMFVHDSLRKQGCGAIAKLAILENWRTFAEAGIGVSLNFVVPEALFCLCSKFGTSRTNPENPDG